MNSNLKCPFCGGEVHLVLTDTFGNHYTAEEAKELNRETGWGYVHEEKDVEGTFCPIATFDDCNMTLGVNMFKTKSMAIKIWNHRARKGKYNKNA